MLIADLPVAPDFQMEVQMQECYPDEVLNAGWNPVLDEIQSLQSRDDVPKTPTLNQEDSLA